MTKKKVVYAQGTWDLFHIGHVNILQRARKMATRLIVGVNTDESVKKYKGSYPVIPYQDRVGMLEACRFVDEVIESDLTFNVAVLKEHAVDAVVLGSDWKNKYLAGKEEVQEEGIEIVYFPYTEGVSTTEIKNAIKRRWQTKIIGEHARRV